MREWMPDADRSPILHMGTFEAELHWRENNLAILPALPDKEAEKIVTAMDELLFCFCKPGDLLLTRYASSPAQLDYTSALGFDYVANTANLEQSVGSPLAAVTAGQLPPRARPADQHPVSVFRLLYEQGQPIENELPLSGAVISPFAWVPYIGEISRKFGIYSNHPSLEIVRRVNTKRYSAWMKQHLDLKHPGFFVESAAELEVIGSELLRDGTFLIKDNYGVSGKGNLHIETPSMLTRILSSIRKQEEKGRNVQFVLERFQHKERDFSCQFHITEQGDMDILSVQWLANSQFAYRESLSPDIQFMDRLEQAAYFDIMMDIGRQLYRDGYFGHVCIDSMTLEDGSIEPLVEINARKSMSLIKNSIDRYLRKYNLFGNMTNYTVSHDGSFDHEQLLLELEREGLLFLPHRETGIMPLTSAALSVNHADIPTGKKRKGRLYLSAVAADEPGKHELLSRLEHLLERSGLHILN
ncbi:hypothetical protein ACE3MZ_07260 [Paenibacillus sp. WLX1005]|uniref:hypothetical protein n=1 Tax=Paenibacillus sp. WLX1005 TaxID=3243766 RepID=UPI0039844EF9